MKNIILAAIGTLLTLYTMMIGLGIFSLETRKNELENIISRVVQNTLLEEYQTGDAKIVSAKLIEDLKLEIGSNKNLEIDIQALDLEKGIISVKVTENFRQFNGQMERIVCTKTALVERHYSQNEAVTVHQALRNTQVSNSTFTDAYEYFSVYGSEMAFQQGDSKEGLIYYGTKAKLASSAKTRFENIGWRVSVLDSAGKMIDQIYYSIEGAYMKKEDTCEVDGYKYSLYCVSLENLKSRLSTTACNALKQADCSIIFDACTVVISNGVRKGAMTDDGITSGKVYTTYEGIVNAANWSKKTKETLKTYYGKTVKDLFFEVKLTKGTGITAVSGSGKYCYGTEITIDAELEENYQFSAWVGDKGSLDKKYTFTLYEDVTLTATAAKNLPPQIIGTDIYVSLQDAQQGTVSEQWMAQFVRAQDAEDGPICYGRNAKNAFYVVDFDSSAYRNLLKGGCISQTFLAVDSVGNETRKSIKVHIVEDAINNVVTDKELKTRIRFISDKYFKDEAGNWITEENGGLVTDSIWRLNEEYSAILEALFVES